MDKYIYDESNGLWYELQGDYYIPCLTLPAEKENKPISLWGQRHKHYLQEHKRTVYISLLTSGELNNYLADIDEQATEMMFTMTLVIHYAIMNLIYGIALHLLIWSSIRTGKDYIDCSLCEIKTDYTGGN